MQVIEQAGSSSDTNQLQNSRSRRKRIPELAMWLLAIAFGLTVLSKLYCLHQLGVVHILPAWLAVTASDVVFFCAFYSAAQVIALILPARWAARLVLCGCIIVLFWTVLDTTWLLYTGVQLQPGVLRVIGYSPEEFWPHVRKRLVRRWRIAVPVAAAGLGLGAYLAYRLIRPAPTAITARGRCWRIGVALVTLAVAGTAQRGLQRVSGLQFSGEVLNYSTHAYALGAVFGLSHSDVDIDRGRHVPRAGERPITAPPQNKGRPNVVLILLESTSYVATSLGDAGMTSTPALAALAADGAEFVNTHVPVSQTGKAYWATLTGTRPELYHDYSEAILVDEPYESLATILKSRGYRAAFFEMSKGTFQCAPGVFANMGFDWGWWRENLNDPSASLGYLAGDDFRMLDPAFAWADREESPYLLMMITSVSHDPFLLPEWYGPTPTDRTEAYCKAVAYNDAFVAEVLSRLEQRGMSENTLVCVLGDHGESMRQETKRSRWIPYEEVIRVPWVMRWPGHVGPGVRIAGPTSQIDVTPTILSVLGFGIENAGFEGRNALVPVDPMRRLYFSSWFEDSPEGFVEGSRKVVYWPYHGVVYQFDLDSDPQELEPITLAGGQKEEAIRAIRQWKTQSYLYFAPRRFRRRLLFDHWQALASGRAAWAYYVAGGGRQTP